MRTSNRSRLFRIVVLAAAISAVLGALPAPAPAAVHVRKFQTKSGNIGCLFRSKVLRCDVKGGLEPEPKRDCELDWVGMVLPTDARGRPLCAGDTVRDTEARKLKHDARWKRGGITCRVRRASITCDNSEGHGFYLSGEDWDTTHAVPEG